MTESSRCALVVATPQCRIEFANADARRWIEQFFAPSTQLRQLPAEVCLWLARGGGKSTLVVKRDAKRLFVRRYRPQPKDSIALLMEIFGENGAGSRTHKALTRRENEVLGWIAAGKTDRDIAEILGLSPKTVGKHIERILAKLGVDNRTSAASVHLESTRTTSS